VVSIENVFNIGPWSLPRYVKLLSIEAVTNTWFECYETLLVVTESQ